MNIVPILSNAAIFATIIPTQTWAYHSFKHNLHEASNLSNAHHRAKD
jgi:hypothetical protein